MDMDVDDSSASKSKGEDQKPKPKPIVVILVGPPGSGKSTFCEQVMSSSSRPWARICQDTINNGKAGTKPQCLKSASVALKEGKCVLIDRCNMDKEQRVDFVKLGGGNGGDPVDVHSVVFDLPAQLCISRSVKRVGHEGNLQGGRAAAVVNRMLQKKELPQLNEGFSRILFCNNEGEVEGALKMYSELGPLDSLPNGCFGQRKTDVKKVQLGIMKFLKKVDVPSIAGSISDGVQDAKCSMISDGNDPQCRGTENNMKKRKESEIVAKGSVVHDVSDDNAPTLAFPSFSTADFRFDIEKASDIIVEKVEEFVNKHENCRLVLVDLSHASKILSSVRSKAAQRKIDTKKFFTFVGDITQLYSQGGLSCHVIANAANWRLRPGGGGVNAAIFSAAGPPFEVATKERAKSLLPGHAVVVPLPSDSPLNSREGISHVIHILGPNMNPQRPNCLNGDYDKGCKILREAYASLFDGFVSILSQLTLPRRRTENLDMETSGLKDPSHNGDQKFKRSGDCAPERSKKSKGSHGERVGITTNSMHEKVNKDDGKIDGTATKGWGSWAQALYHIAMHPERHKHELLEILDDVVVLNDLYPKAQKHILVLARYEGLDCLADVHQEHLELLMSMHSVGMKWAEKFLQEDPSMIFRLGYHSVPSMRQLHFHVISQDFNSSHLKNKKHWKSFNSPFFRDSVDVIEELRNHGKAMIKDDHHLSMELRCHRCRSAHPNIPKLKSHISTCRVPFPPPLLERGCLLLTPNNTGDP